MPPTTSFYIIVTVIVLIWLVALAQTKRLIFFWVTVLCLVIWFWLPAMFFNVSVANVAAAGALPVTDADLLRHIKYEFAFWYPYPLIACFALIFTYLWWGGAGVIPDDITAPGASNGSRWRFLQRWKRTRPSTFYTDIVAPRRTLWLVFTIVALSTLLVATGILIELQERIAGQQPLLRNLKVAIESIEMHDAVHSSDSAIYKLGMESGLTREMWYQIFNEVDLIESHALHVERLSRQLSTLAQTSSAPSDATNALQPYLADLKPWLAEVNWLSADIVSATQKIMGKQAIITRAEVYTPTNAIQESYRTLANDMTVFRFLDANIAVRSTTPFVTVAILYAVFLFFPWLIYFSYLLSKRMTLPREARRDLEDFGLLDKFLDPRAPTWDRAQSIAKQLASAAKPLADAQGRSTGDIADGAQTDAALAAIDEAWNMACEKGEDAQYHEFQKLMCRNMVTGRYTATEAARGAGTAQWTLAYHEAIEVAIKLRQFYNREYVIALVLFTIVSAVGWYYVFFSGSAVGLREFIGASNASAAAFNQYLANNLTPVTAAFIGAWLFSVLYLLRNWTLDDLNPRSFFYAATRLIVGMLVGLVLANLLPTSAGTSATDEAGWANLLAFIVGIFPYAAVAVVVQECFKLLPRLARLGFGDRLDATTTGAPVRLRIAWMSRHRLDELDDVTAWDEARLEQEGIDSVHALALANPERLVINTPYEGPLIVDWLDQALLRVHSPDDLVNWLYDIGVRSATDLISILCPEYDNARDFDVPACLRRCAANAHVADERLAAMAGALTSRQDQVAQVKLARRKQEGAGDAEVQTAEAAPAAILDPATLASILVYLLNALAAEPNMIYVTTFRKRRHARLVREMGALAPT